VVLAAFAPDDAPSSGSAMNSQPPLALPTLEPPQTGVVEACPEALFGPVRLEQRIQAPDAPVVAIPATGEEVALVWSREFDATFNPLVIRNVKEDVVARGGQDVWLTGGAAEGGGYYVCGVSISAPSSN